MTNLDLLLLSAALAVPSIMFLVYFFLKSIGKGTFQARSLFYIIVAIEVIVMWYMIISQTLN